MPSSLQLINHYSNDKLKISDDSQGKKTAKESLGDDDSLNTPQVPPKYPSSRVIKREDGGDIYDYEKIAELCGVKRLEIFPRAISHQHWKLG